jgi:NFU1 iron-sulfur cluster scaffold homolog, mitochondrial
MIRPETALIALAKGPLYLGGRMPKVLKTTETPNPSARRFHLDAPIWGAGSRDFPNVESAQDHPLAASLFEIPDVAAVFFLDTTLTVTKDSDREWVELITPIADCIESREIWGPVSQFASTDIPRTHSRPNLRNTTSHDDHPFLGLSPSEQVARVQAILDAEVRPGLQSDGGDLDLVACDSHNVVVRYAGACGTCPTSGTGTLAFIEKVLHEQIHPGLTVRQA